MKINLERFVMLSEDTEIAKVENLARKRGCTKSWVYRSVLFALQKKFPNELPKNVKIERPRKFKKAFRQTTICFHGDRARWFSLSRIWQVELGPLIRYGLILFEKGELKLDLDKEITVKEVKKSNVGKKSKIKINGNCYRYMYQNDNIRYDNSEYWSKNSEQNLRLMKRGLENRIYPFILPKKFKIPKCFCG